jgi:curved DNA-binding protein CbpA
LSDARARTPRPVALRHGNRAAALSSVEGFVLSLVDGAHSETELATIAGVGEEELRATLSKLEALGLITFDMGQPPGRTRSGERSSPGGTSAQRPAQPNKASAAQAISVPKPSPIAAGGPSPQDQEAALMAEDVDLDADFRRQVLELHRGLEDCDHYKLLGVARTADKKAVKHAYFELAAKYHPDKHFRKRLGSFKVRMEAVFSRLTLAHDTLANAPRRKEYDAYLEDQARLRGIERVLSSASAETRRAEETIEREARAHEAGPPAPPAGAPAAQPAAPRAPSPEVLAGARRDAFARRLMGVRPRTASSATQPAVSSAPMPTPPPMTVTDAMDALRRRYEERLARGKGAEARKYAAKAEAALSSNQVAEAASAYRVASDLAPDDIDLKRKAHDAQAQADAMLGETHRRQAEYEEKNGQWPEAARSWIRVCELRPDDAPAHQRGATAILHTGTRHLQEATRLGQRACSLEPKNAAARVILANVYLAAGLTLNARRELETAANLAPHDGSIRDMLKNVGKLS